MYASPWGKILKYAKATGTVIWMGKQRSDKCMFYNGTHTNMTAKDIGLQGGLGDRFLEFHMAE